MYSRDAVSDYPRDWMFLAPWLRRQTCDQLKTLPDLPKLVRLLHLLHLCKFTPLMTKTANNEANIKGPATKVVLSLAVCPLKGFCEPLLFSCLPSDTSPSLRDCGPGAQQADWISSHLAQETGQKWRKASALRHGLFNCQSASRLLKTRARQWKISVIWWEPKLPNFIYLFFARKWIKNSCLIISSSVQLPASGTCQAGVESCSHPQL